MRVNHALHCHISNQVTISPPRACISSFSRGGKLMTDWIKNPWPRVFCHRPLHGLRSPCRVAPVLRSRPYITRSGFSFEVIQCEKGVPPRGPYKYGLAEFLFPSPSFGNMKRSKLLKCCSQFECLGCWLRGSWRYSCITWNPLLERMAVLLLTWSSAGFHHCVPLKVFLLMLW